MSEEVAGAEVQVATEEARSMMATVVGQILAIVRTIVTYVMEVVDKITAWIGEHPLATLLMVANICIWVS